MSAPMVSRTAEMAVIGSVLSPDNGGHAFDAVAGSVRAEDFADPLHASAWQAVEKLTASGRPASAIDVAEYLDGAKPHLAPTLPKLGPLVRELASAANVALYAERVAHSARARRLHRSLEAGAQRLAGARRGGDLPDLCEDVLSGIVSAYGDSPGRGTMLSVKEAISATLSAIERRYEHTGDDMVDGLHTGFPGIDKMTGGLRPGELIVIGARPSVGKTSLAVNVAAHVARHHHTLFASLEMPTDQVMLRLLTAQTRLPLQAVRTGKLDDAGYGTLARAVKHVGGLKLHIDDAVGITSLDLVARARRVQRNHGLGLLVVDYLQLLKMYGENRNRAVGEATRQLKGAAKTLGVPIIVLSQLNRESAKNGRRPNLSDLRDSGEIEQDADVVWLIHRDEAAEGAAELIVAKARNGETGMVPMVFDGPSCRFSEEWRGDEVAAG